MTSYSGEENPPTSIPGRNLNCIPPSALIVEKSGINLSKRGYPATVQKIYGAPPPPPEDHHAVIEGKQTILQGMQTQVYELEVLAQSNAVLTNSTSVVMAQLAHMTVTMNNIKAQLKTLASAQTNQSRPKRKFY